MRLLFCSLALILSIPLFASKFTAPADTSDTGFLDKTALPAKMLAARHEFNENNMRGALIIYREILRSEPKNAPALYWTAQCHYRLKRYDLAKDYLSRAVAEDPDVNSDVNFFYGKIHHRLAELDSAEYFYGLYLQNHPNERSYEYEDAQKFIRECEFAKEMMAHPVNVSVENMGRNINSRFDDYAPSITADGKMIVFTSRRSNTEGGEIDEGGDYKFYEDIYFSTWDELKQEWAVARGVEGEVNTPTYDAVLSVAPNGNEMFIYKNNQNSQGDIFKSVYNSHDKAWRTPEKLPKPINTSYFESSISITQDGNTVYFISERPDGFGQGDIYTSTKSASGSWSKPKNLGQLINTDLDEKFVFIHPNGKTLFFASDGHQCLGSYDIFRTEFVNGQWGIPVNLGYPINTVNEESTFSMTSDNNTMLLAAEYADSFGERDIYQIDVSNYTLLSGGYDVSAYGTLVLSVTDQNGNVVKDADVVISPNGSDRILIEQSTGKTGRVRVNLPGNVTYDVRVKARRTEGLLTFKLPMDGEGGKVHPETIVVK